MFNLDEDPESDFDDYLRELLLKQFKISREMYMSLIEIDVYLREIKKGWSSDGKDEIVEKIKDIIFRSKIYEI